MITETLINLFLRLFQGLISVLPSLNFSIPSNICNTIADFFVGITYFFPIKQLLPILVFSLSITAFRILFTLILRIKSFIPTMGG